MTININKYFYALFVLFNISSRVICPQFHCDAIEHQGQVKIYRHSYDSLARQMSAVIDDLYAFANMFWPGRDGSQEQNDVKKRLATLLCKNRYKHKLFDSEKRQEVMKRIQEEFSWDKICKYCLPETIIRRLFSKESDRHVSDESLKHLKKISERLTKEPLAWVPEDVTKHMVKIFEIIQDYVQSKKIAADEEAARIRGLENLREEDIETIQEFCDYHEHQLAKAHSSQTYLLEILAHDLFESGRIDPMSDEFIPQLSGIRQFKGCEPNRMLSIQKAVLAVAFTNLILRAHLYSEMEAPDQQRILKELDKIPDGTINIFDVLLTNGSKMLSLQIYSDEILKIINKLHPILHSTIVRKFTPESCDCLNSIFSFINQQTGKDLDTAIQNIFRIPRLGDLYTTTIFQKHSDSFKRLFIGRMLQEYFTNTSIEYLPILTTDGTKCPINRNFQHGTQKPSYEYYDTESEWGEYPAYYPEQAQAPTSSGASSSNAYVPRSGALNYGVQSSKQQPKEETTEGPQTELEVDPMQLLQHLLKPNVSSLEALPAEVAQSDEPALNQEEKHDMQAYRPRNQKAAGVRNLTAKDKRVRIRIALTEISPPESQFDLLRNFCRILMLLGLANGAEDFKDKAITDSIVLEQHLETVKNKDPDYMIFSLLGLPKSFAEYEVGFAEKKEYFMYYMPRTLFALPGNDDKPEYLSDETWQGMKKLAREILQDRELNYKF